VLKKGGKPIFVSYDDYTLKRSDTRYLALFLFDNIDKTR